MEKRVGRPVKPEEEKRDQRLVVLLTVEEFVAVTEAAARAGRRRVQWVRDELMRSAGGGLVVPDGLDDNQGETDDGCAQGV